MFTTLVESRPVRKRSARGTLASVLLHGTLIAGVVALTMPKPGNATAEPPKVILTIFTPVTPPRPSEPSPHTRQPALPHLPARATETIVVPIIALPSDALPDINAPVLAPDRFDTGGPAVSTGSPSATMGSGSGSGDIVDVNAVERAPHVIGNAPAPRYPGTLRETVSAAASSFASSSIPSDEPRPTVSSSSRQRIRCLPTR